MFESTQATGSMDVSILLPAFNEEEAIGEVIAEIHRVMAAWRGTWEIVVVNDGSADRTQQCAEQAGARVIRRAENGGYGAALKTGIKVAKGEIVAILDADGSYDPTQLPVLLTFFPDYDQVNGARTSEQGTLKPLRVLAKWLIRKLTELLTGKRIPDLNTGFKLFKRDIMLRYFWVLRPGLSCSASMTLAFLCNDHPVKHVPVTYRKRAGKSKFRPVRDSYEYLTTVIRTIVYFAPLRVFVPASVAVLAIAMIMRIDGIPRSANARDNSDILLLEFAVMLFSVGILADIIAAQGRKD
jgi:glycosyltransferase involved in cell wall biosynthesis